MRSEPETRGQDEHRQMASARAARRLKPVAVCLSAGRAEMRGQDWKNMPVGPAALRCHRHHHIGRVGVLALHADELDQHEQRRDAMASVEAGEHQVVLHDGLGRS
jgi:hypothetical protein